MFIPNSPKPPKGMASRNSGKLNPDAAFLPEMPKVYHISIFDGTDKGGMVGMLAANKREGVLLPHHN